VRIKFCVDSSFLAASLPNHFHGFELSVAGKNGSGFPDGRETGSSFSPNPCIRQVENVMKLNSTSECNTLAKDLHGSAGNWSQSISNRLFD
jgi:hypothetical protein